MFFVFFVVSIRGIMQPDTHTASAPGKLILCGEHAVVYGRPAIALPLRDLRATVTVAPAQAGIHFAAPNLGDAWRLDQRPDDPLSLLTGEVLRYLGAPPDLALAIRITSVIPVASGMGSGAAVATALVRALAAHAGKHLQPADVSALVYANERRLHGTPSGIDNTVVAYEQPIWFERNTGPEVKSQLFPISIVESFTVLIGDTGLRSATKLPVGDLRRRWQADTPHYEALFDQVGTITHAARATLASGNIAELGRLLDANHTLLQEIGVSSVELNTLVDAAKHAGALGAKLSGAGWGGVMLALVAPGDTGRVAASLRAAGAANVLETTVAPAQIPLFRL